jgi:hypothetical protein
MATKLSESPLLRRAFAIFAIILVSIALSATAQSVAGAEGNGGSSLARRVLGTSVTGADHVGDLARRPLPPPVAPHARKF